jgi:hypothetical protein
MAATGLGPDTEAVFEVGDGRGEVGGGIDEVVNQHVNLT